jgi:hypothetical protein
LRRRSIWSLLGGPSKRPSLHSETAPLEWPSRPSLETWSHGSNGSKERPRGLFESEGGCFPPTKIPIFEFQRLTPLPVVFPIVFPRSKWLAVAAAEDAPNAKLLLYSLLNTICAYDPTGYGVP